MKAKYSGKCYKCGGAIKVGEEIAWEKGRGACHAKCEKSPDPILNSAPPIDSAGNVDPVDAAAAHGRTAVAGATLKTFSVHGLSRGDDGDPNGTVHLSRGKRYLQISRSRRQYLSRDWLDDMDEFGCAPGGAYDWQGVEVEPNKTESAADAEQARKKSEAESAKQAEREAKAAEQARLSAWVKQAISGLVQCSVRPATEFTRGECGEERSFTAISGDGWSGWEEHWSAGDDWRTYYYLTESQAKQACIAAAKERGITVERAHEWLEKYAQCHGADVYRAVIESSEVQS